MAVFFNGRLLTTPTVASQVFDQGMLDQQPATGNTLAIIGVSSGGAPTTPEWLRSISEARAYLKGGNLLRAVEMAFSPSNETAGPQSIVAVRLNVATNATLDLADSASRTVCTVSSTDFGVANNSIKVKIESGTHNGKKVSVAQGTTLYRGDDLDYEYFTVRYKDPAKSGYITIADAADGSDTTVTLETKTGTVYTTVATIRCSNYPTIGELVNRINAEGDGSTAGFIATIGAAMDEKSSIATMENTTGLARHDITYVASPISDGMTVTGHVQAIVDWMMSGSDSLVDAARTPQGTLGCANQAYLFLSGGTDGADPTIDEWLDCLEALENEDVQWIVPLCTDPTIAEDVWAATNAHVEFMSNQGKRERRAFVGCATTGETIDAVSGTSGYAVELNSDRVAFCYPGIYHYNDSAIYMNRSMTLYPSCFTAAILGGAFAGINPGETMTNRTLNVMGIESPGGISISSPGDTDDLINGGVLGLYKDRKGVVRVARACSTWLADNRYNRVEISTGCAVDYTCREVREKLQTFVGKKASPTTLQSVNAMVDSVLRNLATPEPIGLGLLVGDSAHPAYKNISSSIVGDVLRVTFECSPAIPINYILVSVHVTPYTSVII